MKRFAGDFSVQQLHNLVAVPQMLALILVIDVVAYFGGLLYWYGYVMADSATPMWAWPFIPDCPLFGLLGGLGLLVVTARDYWSAGARFRAQRYLLAGAAVSLLLWLSTYLPGASQGWSQQGAMLGLWGWVLLLVGLLFHRAPSWLLGLFAFGQIKYGIWTVTAWLLFWQNTAAVNGSPLFTFESVFMTIMHIGLVAQGLFLLSYFRPNLTATVVSFGWFALSDYIDYGLGFYPAIPEQFIPLSVMKWSTIAVTFALSACYLWIALKDKFGTRPEEAREGRASQFA